MTIAAKIQKISDSLPSGVRLIAVSKTRTKEDILQAYTAGQRIFAENRAQEMADKFPVLPSDIEWHFIGHLQTNKVKFIAPFVSLIHSVDSLKLLKEIDREAAKNNRTIPCLLQFHIAEEESKSGLTTTEAVDLLASADFGRMKNIQIDGVMGMATFTGDKEQVRKEFRQLKAIFVSLREKFFRVNDAFRELSMGMSDDYPIAIEEGSTMVRIGTHIFGSRK